MVVAREPQRFRILDGREALSGRAQVCREQPPRHQQRDREMVRLQLVAICEARSRPGKGDAGVCAPGMPIMVVSEFRTWGTPCRMGWQR